LIFILLHICIYRYYSKYRENAYLRNYTIGVDIDGVLNTHRSQFCKFVDKPLSPSQITSLPIHDDPSIGITREDEKKVFNNTQYWTEMPVREYSQAVLQKLSNSFQLKIHIFTHRPWPMDKKISKEMNDSWVSNALNYYESVYLSKNTCRVQKILCDIFKIIYLIGMKIPFESYRFKPISLITMVWLYQHDIKYNKLIVELGGEDIPDPSTKYRNRFYHSRKKPYKFFVEDDPIKASQLAYFCDIVFLIKHPYNESSEVPKNVIKVDTWNEIYQYIKKV